MLALVTAFFISNIIGAIGGFGSVVVGISLSAFFVPDITEIVPIVVPIDLLACSYLAFKHHQHVHWKELLKRILPLVIFGVVISKVFMMYFAVDAVLLKMIYGVFILGFAVVNLHKEFRVDIELAPVRAKKNPFFGYFLLLMGGVMSGVFASGGPMIVSDVSQRIKDKYIFRSTLSMLWVLVDLVLLANLYSESKITTTSLKTSLYLIPSVMFGIVIGEMMHSRVNEKIFRRFVFSMLCVSGLALIWSK